MSILDHIDRMAAGEELSAGRHNEVMDAIDRNWFGTPSQMDTTGTYLSRVAKRRIARVEVYPELLLPQSGSGKANATFLNWIEGGADGNLTGLDATEVKVVDTMRCHSKMATQGGDVGAYGIAWIPDDPQVHAPYNSSFELLYMQTPGDFLGILNGGEVLSKDNETPPSDGDKAVVTVFDVWGTGHRTFGGYDAYGPGWASEEGDPTGAIPYATVYNLPRENQELLNDGAGGVPTHYWFNATEGDLVYCRWHMRENRYYVRNIPNNLRVIGSDGASDPVNQTNTMVVNFDNSDFVVTSDGDGGVTVALR